MAKLFNINYDKEGKGIGKNVEMKPGFIRFFEVFFKRFWQMAMLNVLYIFACLPIVTIGPATAGLTYVLRNYSQSKPTFMLSDFVGKAKECFKKGFVISLIDILITVVLCVSIMQWSAPDFPVASWMRSVALIFIFFVLYVFVCANFYVFPMLVSYNLTLKQLIRNSVILGMYKLKQNLIMLILFVLIILAAFLFWPASLPIIFMFLFSTLNLIVNFVVFPVLEKHVSEAREEKEDETESIFKDRT